jgi:hypothetical protein
MQHLQDRATEPEHLATGHALMLTCPPDTHAAHDPSTIWYQEANVKVPEFSFPELPNQPIDSGEVDKYMDWTQDNWQQEDRKDEMLMRFDLLSTLAISKQVLEESNIDDEREITPVMAWALIMEDPRAVQLGQKELMEISLELSSKVSCYG